MKSIENLKNRYPIQTGMNNFILRQKSKQVEKIDQEILEFADVLMDLMYEYDGVGLAAPQIGNNIRMIAVTGWKVTSKKEEFLYEKIMINPQITWFSDEKIKESEGCLSLPGQRAKVERSKQIVVKYMGIDGKNYENKLSGLNARIVQHEIDHLDGILFMDRVDAKEILNIISSRHESIGSI